MNIETRLKELGLELPAPPQPSAIYKPVTVVGNLLYTSGHVSVYEDGTYITGRIRSDDQIPEFQEAARLVGLNMLSSIKAELGNLEKVKRLIKTLGMVNSFPEFNSHHLVMNGYSMLMRDVFGPDQGVGARSAIGMMLPHQVKVEIEAIFEIEG